MTRAAATSAVVVALLVAATSASAKTYEVTRHNDPKPGKCKPNDCSLREAVRAANKRAGKDTVVLPDRAPRYELKRANQAVLLDEDVSKRGDLDVTGKTTIVHPGKGLATIDANGIDRVLEVYDPTRLVGIKLTGGNNPSEDPPIRAAGRRGALQGDGAGIETHAPLTLVRSAVVGNKGAEGGGGIDVKPDFVAGTPASLVLIRTRVARNSTVESTGGGIHAHDSPVKLVRSTVTRNNSASAGGGVVVSTGSVLRIVKSTMADNRARFDPVGVYLYESDATIKGSTISGNVAREDSGGGAGIGLTLSKLTISNSTVAGNRTPTDGAGISTSIPEDEVLMNGVTVVRNRADADGDGFGSGGGLFDDGGSWNVINSVVALNRSGDGTDDCSGTFDSAGGNLLSDADGCGGFEPGFGDFLSTAPKLGALKRNGGPTKTIALRKGSPAIGKAVKAAAPKRDQRGVKRDNKPDIGAYER